ncbi:MAG: NAD-dependent deacylase, partial [Anaerolineaceae bacterium]|nr:NAD-dependent deacylase [Anaerolineaceae bacterium]
EIKKANRVIAFTGAGISVESGIPPFRGPSGIWSDYDSSNLDIRFFLEHPETAWPVIKEIFYDNIGKAQPNAAHHALAEMEALGIIDSVITQNIDDMHQKAGSIDVIEFHGNSQRLICLSCKNTYSATIEILKIIPPRCPACDVILKPDFIFFGEAIPPRAFELAMRETKSADVWLIIGTTGEVYPAASLPFEAKKNRKKIMEINIQPSNFTYQITDHFLQGKAAEITPILLSHIISK